MPELPEVETIVRELRESPLIGATITKAHVFWGRSVVTHEQDEFDNALTNQKIEDVGRRGKFIVIHLSKSTLLIHLRMTGKFSLTRSPEPTIHERVQLELSNGYYLHFADQRKFGKWYLVDDTQLSFAKLGLEPFSEEFTLQALSDLLLSHSQAIKPFLLDQRYIVGLGNIYVDEALWESKVHPLRRTNSLTSTEIKALYKAIPNVLQQGIENMGTTLGSHLANYFSVSGRRGGNQKQLKVFRREGLQCPRCHHQIVKIKVAQRGTHICPHCQKKPD